MIPIPRAGSEPALGNPRGREDRGGCLEWGNHGKNRAVLVGLPLLRNPGWTLGGDGILVGMPVDRKMVENGHAAVISLKPAGAPTSAAVPRRLRVEDHTLRGGGRNPEGSDVGQRIDHPSVAAAGGRACVYGDQTGEPVDLPAELGRYRPRGGSP